MTKNPLTGEPLCKRHFIESVTERAAKEFEKVSSRSLVLMAVSGGKDSLVLMDVAARIWDSGKLAAITVVEGAEGYERKNEIEVAATLARQLGIKYFVTSFKRVYGKSLAEMVKVGRERPCSYCGVFRRRLIELAALKLGADVIATGHTLDDEVHTGLLNLLRGDWEGISKLAHGRLKPLRRVLEREVAIYAYLRGFPFQKEECPYINLKPSLRARIREDLFDFTKTHAEKLMDWVSKLEGLEVPSRTNYCKLCGFPTSERRETCRACEFSMELGVKIIKKNEAESLYLKRLA